MGSSPINKSSRWRLKRGGVWNWSRWISKRPNASCLVHANGDVSMEEYFHRWQREMFALAVRGPCVRWPGTKEKIYSSAFSKITICGTVGYLRQTWRAAPNPGNGRNQLSGVGTP